MERPSSDDLVGQIRDIWDSAADHYDSDPGHGLLSEDERQHWLRVIRLLVPPDPPQRVLDVGTGPGVMAFLLAEVGHSVTGLDIAPAMLDHARAKNESTGAGARFELGAAASPPFPPGSFDVVFSRHVFWTMPDPAAALNAWRSVLAPGGRLVIIDGLWPHGVRDRLALFGGKVLGWLTRQGADGHAYPKGLYKKLPMVRARSLDDVRRVIESAGFSAVHAEFIERGESHTPKDLREWLLNRWRSYALTASV